MFRVTMDACVAGNPLRAWKVRLPDGERRDDELAPDREPPNDVWESQTHEFATLTEAKVFIRELPEATTTHVRLQHETDDEGWVTTFDQDADGDHLDAAGPDVDMPHTVDSRLPFMEGDEIPDAPPLVPSQGDGQ